MQDSSAAKKKEVLEINRDNISLIPTNNTNNNINNSNSSSSNNNTADDDGGVVPAGRFYFGMNGFEEEEEDGGVPSLPTAVGKVKENQALSQPYRKPR